MLPGNKFKGAYSSVWSERRSYMKIIRKDCYLLDSSKRAGGPRFKSE